MSDPNAPTRPSPPSGSGKQMWRAPGLAEGEVLAGRFQIVRFIARGGMGEVYEAEDQVLRERVALKTIRPDVAGDERAMERFLREVHLARSVTHPNVCRTFDVFHHGTPRVPDDGAPLRRDPRRAPLEGRPPDSRARPCRSSSRWPRR